MHKLIQIYNYYSFIILIKSTTYSIFKCTTLPNTFFELFHQDIELNHPLSSSILIHINMCFPS